jgi:hypothetical protein
LPQTPPETLSLDSARELISLDLLSLGKMSSPKTYDIVSLYNLVGLLIFPKRHRVWGIIPQQGAGAEPLLRSLRTTSSIIR